MSTKKDLVEAHAFSRRRLVTAFVSGAPGGREVEPSRPGRTIVGGVALGVLVLAGGAIAGVFSGRPPDGWLDPGLVAAGGSLYAITEESDDPELRPIDPISGRLVFGVDTEPSEVSVEDVAQQRTGGQIGILGAPSALPSPDLLIDEGWVSCVGPAGGIATTLADPPPAEPAMGAGLVVTSGQGTWLIAYAAPSGDDPDPQAFRLRLPQKPGAASQVLGQLGLPSVEDEWPEVPREWLDLWPLAPALNRSSFSLEAAGSGEDPTDYFEGVDGSVAVGDVVEVDGQPYLATPEGPALLGEFAGIVYGVVGEGVSTRQADSLDVVEVSGTPPEWPLDAPTRVDDGSLCAMLEPRVDDTATVLIAEGYTGRDELLEQTDKTVSVQEGRGAFVYAAASTDELASPYVVDARGFAYLLEGVDAIQMLGYADHDARVVPDAWMSLLECGVVLSRDAALRPPGESGESGTSTDRPAC